MYIKDPKTKKFHALESVKGKALRKALDAKPKAEPKKAPTTK